MKQIPPYMATAKVHMKQIRKNIHYTKIQDTHPTKDEPMETLETCFNHTFSKIIDTQQQIATDPTVQFLVTYNRGNK